MGGIGGAVEQADAADEARSTCRCARFAREASLSRASQLIRGVRRTLGREAVHGVDGHRPIDGRA